MNIKKTLSCLLTFVILFSFSFTTQSFASEKSTTPQSVTFKVDETKNTNETNKSEIEASKIEIPHYIQTVLKFSSPSSFNITTQNIGISALTNIVYTASIYDSGNKERATSVRPAGALGVLSTFTDTFSYQTVIIDHVVLTIESTTNTGKKIKTTDTIYR